jgi:thiol:disulfide interchange protein
VLILAFAAYYGYLAYSLFRTAPQDDQPAALLRGLTQAEAEGKPVFIDFWATWCKNCLAMEKTTFLDEQVAARMKDFVVVKFQAEKPNESPSREVLAYFQAKGLPTYVILTPGK